MKCSVAVTLVIEQWRDSGWPGVDGGAGAGYIRVIYTSR
jgi:hypothetical protein